MSENSIRLIPTKSVPIADSKNTDANPTSFRLYEIDLDIVPAGIGNEKEVRIQYTYCLDRSITGYQDFITKMVDLVTATGHHGGTPKPRPGKNGSRLSVNWSNSAGTDWDPTVRYLVFRLSDDLDWEFASGYPPFSKHEDNKAFVGALKFDRVGVAAPGSAAVDRCTYACFIVDGSTLPAQTDRRFNIHIDLLERDQGSVKNRIPIIIDPDVRHPGGSGGGGNPGDA